jgi:hypothetical protein
MIKTRTFRLLLPLTMVMILTWLIGLPATDSHAQSAEQAATEATESKLDADAPSDADATPQPSDEAKAGNDEAADQGDENNAEKASKDEKKKDVDWQETTAPLRATAFVQMIGKGQFEAAYAAGSPLLRGTRSAAELKDHMTEEGLLSVNAVEWENGVATEGGLRLDGTATTAGGKTLPIYAIVLEEGSEYRVLDVQSVESFPTRIVTGTANTLDWMIAAFLLAMMGALIFIIWRALRKRSARQST